MRHVLATGIVLATAVVALSGHNFGTNPPTWNREVSRLVFDKCASCHRPDGTAFSLMTYQDAQPRAVAIRDAVLARQMPPWGAVKGFGRHPFLFRAPVTLPSGTVIRGLPSGATLTLLQVP
jgi:hypothetical protein